MLANGDDPRRSTTPRSTRALKRIKKAFKSGQIRQFTGNDYADKLAKGDIVAAVACSGDMVQLLADNPNLQFQIPQEGGMIWTDNMLIPKGGDAHNASRLHELRLRPEDRGADRGLRQLHLPRQGRGARCC